jgi:protein-L-isoaspartate(D-aspartate) O-methyltransferase
MTRRPAPRPTGFPLGLDRLGNTSSPPAPSGSSVPREPLRPQRLLHQAAQDASRLAAPSGLGMDSAKVRQRMVQRLRADGVRSEALLAAMEQVPRHHFVDTALAIQAYEDTSLPIGHGQTISKPSVVARMIDLLLEGANARRDGQLGQVLEIGTGCGYQTAVLACVARHVVSIERVRPLFDKARANLAGSRLNQVRLVHGDGMLGHGPRAPYDSIIAAAGGEDLPQAWLDQLAVGGRLVAPMVVAGGGQALMVVDRSAGGWTRRQQEAVHFVPLKSGVI